MDVTGCGHEGVLAHRRSVRPHRIVDHGKHMS
jgi:hypothetical protein